MMRVSFFALPALVVGVGVGTALWPIPPVPQVRTVERVVLVPAPPAPPVQAPAPTVPAVPVLVSQCLRHHVRQFYAVAGSARSDGTSVPDLKCP